MTDFCRDCKGQPPENAYFRCMGKTCGYTAKDVARLKRRREAWERVKKLLGLGPRRRPGDFCHACGGESVSRTGTEKGGGFVLFCRTCSTRRGVYPGGVQAMFEGPIREGLMLVSPGRESKGFLLDWLREGVGRWLKG